MTTATEPTDLDQAAPLPDGLDGMADPPPRPAPWGRVKSTGAARGKPGPKARPSKVTAPPRKTAKSTPPRPAQADGEDFREGLTELAEIPVAVLASVGMAIGKMALIADAATVDAATPKLVEGINLLARDFDQVAKVVRVLTKTSPYVVLTTAVLGVLAQVAVNHGRMPAGWMQTKPPEQIIGDWLTRKAEADPNFAQTLAHAQAAAAGQG